MTARLRAWGLAVALLTGCDNRLDLVVDAADYAASSEAVSMQVDLVAGGEIQSRHSLDLLADPTLRAKDVVQVGATHGVVAFADVDGDGECDLEVDDGWLFVYDPVPNDELAWNVDRDTFRDLQACLWFNGAAPDFDPSDPG